MKENIKSIYRPYLILFCMGLIVAILARIGLAIMANLGIHSFDYISATDVATLDVICSVLTGSALVAFMFLAGLALTMSAAIVALFALLFVKKKANPSALLAFLVGWIGTIAVMICMFVVASGIFSPVQISSMSSKLPATPVLLLACIAFAAIIGTLLAAAMMIICACLSRNRGKSSYGWNLLIWTAVCGVIVLICVIGTFGAINQYPIAAAQVGGWLIADAVINVVIMLVAAKKVNELE